MATSNERCACCGFYIDACACKDTKFRDRIRDLERQLADLQRMTSNLESYNMTKIIQLEQENASLRAMGTAENVRLSALCASLKEENAKLHSQLELMGSWLYSPAQTKKGNHMIYIKDRKAAVLAALYNHSKPQGMGFLHYIQGDMTIEDATKLLQDQTYFDYLHGRVMKVNLYGDELDPWLYDRDNGQGAAQRAIDSII